VCIASGFEVLTNGSPTHPGPSQTGGTAAASNSRSGLGSRGLSTPTQKLDANDGPAVSPLVQRCADPIDFALVLLFTKTLCLLRT